MRWTLSSLVVLAVAFCSAQAAANIVEFRFEGRAGPGLLPGNETHEINDPDIYPPGSGDAVGSGLLYNTETRELSMEFAWGSDNGFTDLTGNVRPHPGGIHIHGPTPEGEDPFETAAGVLIHLGEFPGLDLSATSGGFVGTVTLTEEQEQWLFQHRLYVNVHTDINPVGEIRGNLVPEPGSLALLGVGGLLLLKRRRGA